MLTSDLISFLQILYYNHKVSPAYYTLSQLCVMLYFVSGFGGWVVFFCHTVFFICLPDTTVLQGSRSTRSMPSSSRKFPREYFLFVFTYSESVLSKLFFSSEYFLLLACIYFFHCNNILHWQKNPRGHMQLNRNFQKENRKQTGTC